jgi:hypothetical protein
MVRVCVAAMALAVAAHALQLPGACRSSVSAARRGPVGMALADGVLNVGETRCDARAMPCNAMWCVHAMPTCTHAGVIGAGRIGLVHLEALSSCET